MTQRLVPADRDVMGLTVSKRPTVWIIAALFAAWTIAVLVAPARTLLDPVGTLGVQVDYNGRVKSTDAGSPADIAGVKAGDLIDLAAMPAAQRILLTPSASYLEVGQKIALKLRRDGRMVSVPLVAASLSDPGLPYRLLSALVFLCLALTAFMARPGPWTVGFLIYCVGLNPAVFDERWSRNPSPTSWLVNVVFIDVLIAAALVGILRFVCELGAKNADQWPARLRKMLPILFVVFASMESYPDIATIAWGKPAESYQRAMFALELIALCAGTLIVLQAFASAPARRRALGWIAFGYIVGVYANFIAGVLLYSSLIPTTPPATATVLVTLNLILPVAVWYGIFTEGVLGVKFVLSRALLAVSTATCLALAFDWFGKFVEHLSSGTSHPGEGRVSSAYASTLAVLATGVLLHATRDWVGDVFNRILYARRTAALSRLRDAQEDLYDQDLATDLSRTLLAELKETLRLTYAGLFERDDKNLTLRDSVGSITLSEISWEDPVVGSLRPDNSVQVLDPFGDNGAVCTMLPIRFRRKDVAVILLGPRANFERLDGVEVSAITDYARVAGLAYELVELRRISALFKDFERRIDVLEHQRANPSGHSAES